MRRLTAQLRRLTASTNMFALEKALDRMQKRAKSWMRKWPRDPDTFHLADGKKLLDKLSKLLAGDVKKAASEALKEGEQFHDSYTGGNERGRKSMRNYLDGVKKGLGNIDQAVRDPVGYAKRKTVSYAMEDDLGNAAMHMIEVVEALSRNVRSTNTMIGVLSSR